MTKTITSLALAMGLTFAGAHGAAAQGTGAWTGRGYLNVNGGWAGTSFETTASTTFTIYDEPGTTDTALNVNDGAGLFDVSGGWRVWRNLAAGVAICSFSVSGTATVTASVPHPLFVGRPRTASSTLNGLHHGETAVILQAVWVQPLSPRFDIALSVGPAFVRVKQDLPGTPAITEGAPPFDTVEMQVPVESHTKTATGVGIGADLSYLVTKGIGVGLFIRDILASADFPGAEGGTFPVDAGGFQVGAGVRVRF